MSLQDTATATSETELKIEPRLLIDGRLVTTEQTFPSYNPANGDLVGHAPDATAAEARAAIDAARRAFETTDWSTNVELRIRCLDQLHRALVEHRDELADLTIAEVGATRALCAGPQLDQPIVLAGPPLHDFRLRSHKPSDHQPAGQACKAGEESENQKTDSDGPGLIVGVETYKCGSNP